MRTYVPSTGEPKWTREAAEAAVLLGADPEAEYVVTKSGQLRGVGRADAKVRWTAPAPSDFRGKLLASGVIGEGRLIMASSDGNFLALDTSDGRSA